MKNMEQEIKNVIAKNLPAHVGEVLQKRLTEADKDKKDLESEKTESKLKDNKIKELEYKLAEYSKFDARNNELENREESLRKKENQLEVAILNIKLEAEQKNSEFAKNIGLGLVRNIEYRKNVFDSENQQPYQDSNGNYVYPTPINKSLTETKTVE